MKKLLLIFGLLLAVTLTVSAVNAGANPSITFMGQNYNLEVKRSGGNDIYINEYYKMNERSSEWSERIVVHYYPNISSPLNISSAISSGYIGTNSKGIKNIPGLLHSSSDYTISLITANKTLALAESIDYSHSPKVIAGFGKYYSSGDDSVNVIRYEKAFNPENSGSYAKAKSDARRFVSYKSREYANQLTKIPDYSIYRN